ncbi:actin interacting protein 3-domain-containing protein [Radiomyces spectabilis]|uniref:actin interacting protein 3-domain-containing protein n=1 Tax=Radiomyces spectabilis TaxID=64574 RepID=UPI00221F93E4|nr:actin interacting protein 3-domain-containing protein [Radiomyces spectabilis]KAI8388907.1 actin interacting protein 3-domain-containing protein [Radiomyces spectabilis]
MEQDNSGYAASSASRRPDMVNRSRSRGKSAEIEPAVTRLLRTTKALLEALTMWSQNHVTTGEIFDLYETLENQFHVVSRAFEDVSVPMSDLIWIPRQLRDSVALAMNDEASPMTLNQHLPRIRDVIVHLLHGLKSKQQQLQVRERETSLSSHDSVRSTDSWHRDVPPAALSRGSAGQNPAQGSRPYYPPSSPPQLPSGRLTPSDYDPYVAGIPRPSTSSESARMKYYPARTGSPSTRPTSPPIPGSPSFQPTRMPSPSRSSSSSTNNRSRLPNSPLNVQAPPPPPPPPPSSAFAPSISSSSKISTEFDENEPNTASALAALKRQENLARRSSVRRASMFRANGASDYFPKRAHADTPPVPPLPSHSHQIEPPSSTLATVKESTDQTTTSEPTSTRQKTDEGLTLYLQIGNETKKVYYSGEISMPALRMLFIERFGYSSRQNDFPSIYVKDPSIGVSYELENLDEVKNSCVLSLNITDKDGSNEDEKQRIELVANALGKEMAEFRRIFMEELEQLKKDIHEGSASREVLDEVRQLLSAKKPSLVTTEEVTETPTADNEEESKEEPNEPPSNDVTVDETEVASLASTSPAASAAIGLSVTELKSHLDQVDALRRDMAILRQYQHELQEGTDSVIGELKSKSQQLRAQGQDAQQKQMARSAARLFIEEGKDKLLTSSDKITARLEDLQDTIDQLKTDVTTRKCRPSEVQMTHCAQERKALAQEIEEFGNYIMKVKPTWKKTWEQELQTIVKEQQTLKEQEGLLLDMKDDLDALLEVFEQLEKIYAYQVKARPVKREFRVAPAEEGFEGMSSVLKQVATIDVDHDRRLRALEQADKMRQREVANRIDDFEKELTDFVDSKKLKKTGGALEIDRLRKQKDQDLLKRLYTERQQASAAAIGEEAKETDTKETEAEEKEEKSREENESKEDLEPATEESAAADSPTEEKNNDEKE